MPTIPENAIIIAVAAGAVLLILLAAMLFRSVGGKVRARRGGRIGITEYYEIDKVRRLILIRRDNVEHLVLIGGDYDLLVEGGIGAAAPAYRGEPAPVRPVRPAPAAPEPPLAAEPPIPAVASAAAADPVLSVAGEPRPQQGRASSIFGERMPNLRAVERTEPAPARRDETEPGL